ncbi:MAG: hypothetical protein JO232_04970 [Verrucomicrobia bacterium]|nr:hypothetical protein [Verrucomicrobiota bacterium]
MTKRRSARSKIRWRNRPVHAAGQAVNPYEGTEADDEPGPSIADEIEEHTPAADEQLEGGEES